MKKYRVFIGWPDGRHVKVKGYHFQASVNTFKEAWERAAWLVDNFKTNPYVTGRPHLLKRGSVKTRELDENPTPIGYVQGGTLGAKVYIQKLR